MSIFAKVEIFGKFSEENFGMEKFMDFNEDGWSEFLVEIM